MIKPLPASPSLDLGARSDAKLSLARWRLMIEVRLAALEARNPPPKARPVNCVSAKQAADMLNVGLSTAYARAKAGTLKTVSAGKRLWFDKASLETKK